MTTHLANRPPATVPVQNPTPKLAWVILIATVLGGLLAMAIYPLTIKTTLPGGWGVTGNPVADLFNAIQSALVVPLVAGGFGFVIVRRQIENRVGWLLLLLGLTAMLSALFGYCSIYAYLSVNEPLPSAHRPDGLPTGCGSSSSPSCCYCSVSFPTAIFFLAGGVWRS